MAVGIDPGHIAFIHWESATLPQKRHSAVPNFQPMSACLLWPNGWMDASWYDVRPRSGPHSVRWGPRSSPPSRNGHISPHFSAYMGHMYCGQTAGRIKMPLGTEADLGPNHTVLDGDPARPHSGTTPIFSPCLLLPNGWIDHVATWYGDRTSTQATDGDPVTHRIKTHSPALFGPIDLTLTLTLTLGHVITNPKPKPSRSRSPNPMQWAWPKRWAWPNMQMS